MSHAENHLMRLQDLRLFQAAGSLDATLAQQAALTAGLVGAESCSIMLLDHGGGHAPRMRVSGTHGPLPRAALDASIGSGEGISGQVLAGGRALLVADIGASPLAPLARRPLGPQRSLMCAPIHVDAKVIGVVNVCGARGKEAFTEIDLQLLDVLALFIGKSVQVLQLQGLLDSRFAQLALLREVEDGAGAGAAYRQPDEVARILAKSFFKEMTKAGFGSRQILYAASELIEQLKRHLQRHHDRLVRKDRPDDPIA
jgi:L-methionine (R)-S-oxide reductase